MKNKWLRVGFCLLWCLLVSACQSPYAFTAQTSVHVGEYVSEGYAKRHQGADWIAVSITSSQQKHVINVNFYSRSDVKKPTCQLTTKANIVTENVYLINDDGTTITLQFSGDKLTVSPGKGSDRYSLMYYCSGGGSLVGEYHRLRQ